MRLIHTFLGVKFTIKDYVRTELPTDPAEEGELGENKVALDESDEDLEKELDSDEEDIFGTKNQA